MEEELLVDYEIVKLRGSDILGEPENTQFVAVLVNIEVDVALENIDILVAAYLRIAPAANLVADTVVEIVERAAEYIQVVDAGRLHFAEVLA